MMLTSQLARNMLNKLKRLFGNKSKEKDTESFTNISHIGFSNCQPQVAKDVVIKDVVERLDKLNQGDRIKAVIRNRNSKLGLPDSYVLLISEEEGFLTYDYSELNYNWEIIDFEIINKKE